MNKVEDFWDLIDRFNYKKKRLYVFAHNMAYDYTILKIDSYLSDRDLKIDMRVIDSVFIIKCGSLLFLSSTNYYRNSLKDLGEIFGLSKMESPDFETVGDRELMVYCERDTRVLAHIIKSHVAFVYDKDLGNFKPTIAGQSWTAYTHRFMKDDLLVHNYSKILKMEKQSYRGGRCEAFKMGEFKDIYCLDINSMYPYVMKEFEYPTKLVSSKVIVNNSIQDLKDTLEDGKFALCDCNMVLKKSVIACKRDKLIFPVGKVRQVITSPEVEYLLDNPDCGRIVKVNKLVSYSKAKIFSDFVDYFYYEVRKKTKNKAEEAMSKVILNSLYGKFGQHNSFSPILVEDKKLVKMYLNIMKDTGSFEVSIGVGEKYVKLGEKLYHVKNESTGFARDSIPIIASAVTSYARIMLYKTMKKAGIKNVHYCDTDSVFVNRKGYENLKDDIDANKLGKLKLEKSGIAKIYGAKDYVFNDVVKLKGVKKNAEKLGEGRYRQYQFQTKNKRYSNGTP
ncbi:MAG: hypothetical protein MUP85_06320, partial [Candidatus Lokiarchaeota archaeon]|nr:hypothetical protein [Candidatus Lokiarchaeota archaeon]